jgi:ABC-type sugar transport system ATPase subunit
MSSGKRGQRVLFGRPVRAVLGIAGKDYSASNALVGDPGLGKSVLVKVLGAGQTANRAGDQPS